MPIIEKTMPIGLAIVYGRIDGSIAISQIKFDGLNISGIWDSYDFPMSELKTPFLNHYITGNPLGLKLIKKLVFPESVFITLDDLMKIAINNHKNLKTSLENFIIANPKKQKTISPVPNLIWPDLATSSSYSEILINLGKAPHSIGTPNEMKEIVSLNSVIRIILGNLTEIKNQFDSRKYLDGFTKTTLHEDLISIGNK